MSYMRRLGNQFSISLLPDDDGLTGREYPNPDCLLPIR